MEGAVLVAARQDAQLVEGKDGLVFGSGLDIRQAGHVIALGGSALRNDPGEELGHRQAVAEVVIGSAELTDGADAFVVGILQEIAVPGGATGLRDRFSAFIGVGPGCHSDGLGQGQVAVWGKSSVTSALENAVFFSGGDILGIPGVAGDVRKGRLGG